MATLRPLPLIALASALLISAVSQAQQASPASRIVNPIDENQLVTLKGNVNPHANAKNDRGPVSDSLPMADLTLLLSRTPEQQAAFDAYVQGEYESGSPNYHHWLTPAQIGAVYGPSQSDIGTIAAWLAAKGFNVTHIAPDHMSIGFSGTAGQVRDAFHTEIHQLSVNGKLHIANMTDPQIPAAIAPVVSGLKGLHNFLPHPLHHTGNLVKFNPQAGKWQRIEASAGSVAKAATPASLSKFRPLYGTGYPSTSSSSPYLEEDVSPYDFATIYNVLPLWNAAKPITGSGETIAIVGTSDINPADVTSYRSDFGLAAGPALEEVKGANGIDPGMCTDSTGQDACGLGDLEENSLDVEVSGGVAPGAQVVLVTSGYNSQTAPTNDPLFEGAQYVIENHNNTSSSDPNVQDVASASILSLSYGQCELGMGQSSNVAYYNLWQSAAAEGIAVFVATGDSGAPSCDDGLDSQYGVPYSAQYGLSVNGLASTPFDTAVGGTDFSWCQPVLTNNGNSIGGCPSTTSSPGPYWNSTNSTQGASAKGYVPEIPWNDTCTNPIWAAYLESLEPLVGVSTTSNPEAACNFVYNNWLSIFNTDNFAVAPFVDTVGGSGGASNCVVNDTDSSSTGIGTCTSSASTVTTANGSVTLSNDGWPAPSWQTGSGVTGTAGLTSRAIPDVSFFAGDGSLDSATLFCLSYLGACTPSNSTDIQSMEIGGTSVATPEMAGVMALINQKAGAPQGLPNPQLYQIASTQNYSNCSAEGPPSSSCAFNSIDKGTNAMACNYQGQALEGGMVYSGGSWVVSNQNIGAASPNCALLNSGDTLGTLVSSGTTPAYNATAGFNMATGLGSMNVANLVNAWVSDMGTATASVAATLSAATITANVALTVKVTVSGSSGTPTGYVTVSGGGASQTEALASGSASVTIAANSLAVGSDTIIVTYSGDSTYAQASTATKVTVTAIAPTVTVSALSQNAANPLVVTVAVAGPLNSATPTGTVTLSATGGYNSTAATLASDGTASITVPANSLPAGTDTLTVSYSGNSSTYTTATGTESVVVVGTPTISATATVKPAQTSVDTGQNLDVTITLTGSGGLPTGTVTLTSGSTYTSGALSLTGGIANVTIEGCSSTNTNCLAAGTDTLTASYSGDPVYAFSASAGTATVTVTQSTYTLAASTASPSSVSQGGTATSTITGAASTSGYVGSVTLNSCSITTSPTNAANLPICSVSGTIAYPGGSTDTPTGTGTATVTTFSNTAMLETHPFKILYGAGGTVLAFLVFLGIPARRKSWRALLGAVVLLAGLGTLSACGGGNNGGTTTSNATTPGSYTFTVTGTGNDSASTQATTTFTLTVN